MIKLAQTAVILTLSVTLGLYAASSAVEAMGDGPARTCPMNGSNAGSCPYGSKTDQTKSSCPFSGGTVPSPGLTHPRELAPRDEV